MRKLQKFSVVALLTVLALLCGCEPDSAPVAGTVDVTVELKGFTDFSEVVVWGENQVGTVSSSSITLKPDALSGSITLPAGDWTIKASVMKDTGNGQTSIAIGSASVSVIPNNAVSAVIRLVNEITGMNFSASPFEGAVRHSFWLEDERITELEWTRELAPGIYTVYGMAYDSNGSALAEGSISFSIENGKMTDVSWTSENWKFKEFTITTDVVEGAESYWLSYDGDWTEWHDGMNIRIAGEPNWIEFYMQARDAGGNPLKLSELNWEGDTATTDIHFASDTFGVEGPIEVSFLFPDGEGNSAYTGLDEPPYGEPDSTVYSFWKWFRQVPGTHYAEADVIAADGTLLGTCYKEFESKKADITRVEAEYTPLPANVGKFNFAILNWFPDDTTYVIEFNGKTYDSSFSELLSAGSYSLKVTANGPNGLIDTVTKNVVIENGRLSILVADEAFWVGEATIDFTIVPYEGAHRYLYTVDEDTTGYPVLDPSAPVSLSLAKGNHNIIFYAVDELGNTLSTWSSDVLFSPNADKSITVEFPDLKGLTGFSLPSEVCVGSTFFGKVEGEGLPGNLRVELLVDGIQNPVGGFNVEDTSYYGFRMDSAGEYSVTAKISMGGVSRVFTDMNISVVQSTFDMNIDLGENDTAADFTWNLWSYDGYLDGCTYSVSYIPAFETEPVSVCEGKEISGNSTSVSATYSGKKPQITSVIEINRDGTLLSRQVIPSRTYNVSLEGDLTVVLSDTAPTASVEYVPSMRRSDIEFGGDGIKYYQFGRSGNLTEFTDSVTLDFDKSMVGDHYIGFYMSMPDNRLSDIGGYSINIVRENIDPSFVITPGIVRRSEMDGAQRYHIEVEVSDIDRIDDILVLAKQDGKYLNNKESGWTNFLADSCVCSIETKEADPAKPVTIELLAIDSDGNVLQKAEATYDPDRPLYDRALLESMFPDNSDALKSPLFAEANEAELRNLQDGLTRSYSGTYDDFVCRIDSTDSADTFVLEFSETQGTYINTYEVKQAPDGTWTADCSLTDSRSPGSWDNMHYDFNSDPAGGLFDLMKGLDTDLASIYMIGTGDSGDGNGNNEKTAIVRFGDKPLSFMKELMKANGIDAEPIGNDYHVRGEKYSWYFLARDGFVQMMLTEKTSTEAPAPTWDSFSSAFNAHLTGTPMPESPHYYEMTEQEKTDFLNAAGENKVNVKFGEGTFSYEYEYGRKYRLTQTAEGWKDVDLSSFIGFRLVLPVDANYADYKIDGSGYFLPVPSGGKSDMIATGRHTILIRTMNQQEDMTVYTGTYTVTLDFPEAKTTAVTVGRNDWHTSGTVDFTAPVFDGAASYSFVLDGKTYKERSFSADVHHGDYQITGKAMNADGIVIAERVTAPFTVEVGEQVSVKLPGWTPVSNAGTLTINVAEFEGAAKYMISFGTEEPSEITGMKYERTLSAGTYKAVIKAYDSFDREIGTWSDDAIKVAVGNNEPVSAVLAASDVWGKVTLNVTNGIASLSGDDWLTPVRWTVEGKGSKEVIPEKDISIGAPVVIDKIYKGEDFTFTVRAYNSYDKEIGSGTVTAKAGMSPVVNVMEKAGEGTVSVIVNGLSAKDAPEVRCGSVSVPVKFAGGAWKGTLSVQNGTYDLSVKVGSVVKPDASVRVVAGRKVEASYSFDQSAKVIITDAIRLTPEISITVVTPFDGNRIGLSAKLVGIEKDCDFTWSMNGAKQVTKADVETVWTIPEGSLSYIYIHVTTNVDGLNVSAYHKLCLLPSPIV